MNHLTTCSPPVPRPVPFGNRRSTCSLSPSLRGQEQVRPVPRPVPQGGDSTTTHPITHHRKDAPMSTSDRDETITDRAAIRDSADEREPERVCCDGGHANFPPLPDDPETTPEQRAGLDEVLAKVWPDPAPGATVTALDLDAITRRATYLFPTYARRVLDEDVPALVAEVRSLRAKVAEVEAVEDSWSRRTLPWPAWPHVHQWLRDLRAALATGEGQHVAREVFTAEGIANSSDYGTGYQDGQSDELASIADTCCGKCPGGTCYVDQVTGA